MLPPPPSTWDDSPPHMADLADGSDSLKDQVHIDYKQLEAEVARQISPDIQEILAGAITNILSKIQADMAQHSLRLDNL